MRLDLGLRLRCACGAAVMAAALASCGPRVAQLERAPVVGIAVAPPPPKVGDPPPVAGRRLDVGSAVKLGPRLLLTAGHVIPGSHRALDRMLLFVDEASRPGESTKSSRIPMWFSVAAAGRFEAGLATPDDGQARFFTLDHEAGDWILLRPVDSSLPPPYAELDWSADPKEGDALALVTPRGRFEKDPGLAGIIAVEGEVLDVMVGDESPGPDRSPVGAKKPLPAALLALEIGRNTLQGCSGSMIARRGPTCAAADASEWPMVGMYVASSADLQFVLAGRFAPFGRRVQFALRLTAELRDAIERELACDRPQGSPSTTAR